MSDNKGTRDILISKAFDKWADKTWFQVLTAIIIIYLLLAPIIGPIFYNRVNKQNTTEAVINTLNQREIDAREKHKIDFERSKQTYAIAKQVLKHYLEPCWVDYMFLVEYHNGLENVMSGIQFCRFDITLEVTSDKVPFVQLDKYKDDIVARYDLLLSEEFNNSTSAFYFKVDELRKVDRYLQQHLITLNAKSCAIINITDKEGLVCGSLLCVSLDDNINIPQIYRCQRELENVFKK